MSLSMLWLTEIEPSALAEMPLAGVALSPHPHEGLSTYQNAVGVIAYGGKKVCGGRSVRWREQAAGWDVPAKANDIEGDNMWQYKHGWCEGNILGCCTQRLYGWSFHDVSGAETTYFIQASDFKRPDTCISPVDHFWGDLLPRPAETISDLHYCILFRNSIISSW